MSALPTDGVNSRVAEIIEKVNDVAVLPQVVFKVLELTSLDDTSPLDIEKAIIVDPGFSAKLLSLANSAYMALPRKVTSIKDAALCLGFNQIRQLAMAVGVFDMFVGKADKESVRRRNWWKHSLDTAIASKYVASQSGCANSDEAYTCGLLHLIGKTILDRFDPAAYENVIAAEEMGVPDRYAEDRFLKANHVEVSQAVAEKWSFPSQLVYGLNYLDAPVEGEASVENRASVAIGSRIASICETNKPEMIERYSHLPEWALEILHIDSSATESLIAGGVAEIVSCKRGV